MTPWSPPGQVPLSQIPPADNAERYAREAYANWERAMQCVGAMSALIGEPIVHELRVSLERLRDYAAESWSWQMDALERERAVTAMAGKPT